MKDIVICCDGTGNEYGDTNSNVIKLFRALVRDDAIVTYYHPGVGTMGAKNALTTGGKFWTKVRGLAFGYGLSENIADAYGYLMRTFEPGDRIFIFGFSRGAYTARALCGMLQMFGLLRAGNEGQIPYAMRLFKSRGKWFSSFRALRNKFAIARGFKTTFCIECKPHFLGLWDTVSSVGWIIDPLGLKPGGLPYTYSLGDVSIIRHALSIDEKRAFFRQNMVTEQAGRNIKQVWFAGVHSDVGGSYPEAESGLSKISLSWMFRESQAAGLRFEQYLVERVLGHDPSWAKPLPNAVMHRSLQGIWILGEFVPKFTRRRISAPGVSPEKFHGYPRLNLFRRRFIPDGARIHESVMARKAMVPKYAPSNLPRSFTTETGADTAIYPLRLKPGESIRVGVFANLLWNDTGIQVGPGETYRFDGTGTWHDATVAAGPSGYMSSSWLFRMSERFRRAPRENWFALIGTISQDLSSAFLIAGGCDKTIPREGILYCFANDVPSMYFNNSGCVTLRVTRTS